MDLECKEFWVLYELEMYCTKILQLYTKSQM